MPKSYSMKLQLVVNISILSVEILVASSSKKLRPESGLPARSVLITMTSTKEACSATSPTSAVSMEEEYLNNLMMEQDQMVDSLHYPSHQPLQSQNIASS